MHLCISETIIDFHWW